MTPSDARVQRAAQFIETERARGRTDDQIRALLEAANISISHPCSSPLLQNICDRSEVQKAFDIIEGGQDGVNSLLKLGVHPLVLIAAGTGVAIFAGGLLKKAAAVGGLSAAGYWIWRNMNNGQ